MFYVKGKWSRSM